MYAREQGNDPARGDAQHAAVHVGHEELPGEARRARIRAGGGKGTNEITGKRVPQSRRHPRGRDDGPSGEAPPRTRVPAVHRALLRYRRAADPGGEHSARPGQDYP